MEFFSPLGDASISLSIRIATEKTAYINVKKTEFELGVTDNQIIRQKLQMPNILVLEITLHGAQRGTALPPMSRC
jgi:hypothetical protein